MTYLLAKYIKGLPSLAWIILCGVLLVGCHSAEDNPIDEVGAGNTDVQTYITLSISTLGVDANSRTNPTGGENGDGIEVGINNENKLHNVTLFLFDSNNNNNVLNTTDNPEVRSLYVEQFAIEGSSTNNYTYKTRPIRVAKQSITNNTRVIAVANAGNMSSSITNLDDLRGYISYNQVVKQGTDIAAYDRFVMSSASLSSGFILSKDGKELGSYETPATTSVTIQRMAARIDIVPNATFSTDGYYEYTITDTHDKVRVTHITAFNCWKPESGQYLLKRVSSDGTDYTDPVYLGKETPDTGVQTNYVLSCEMPNKTSDYWRDNQSTVTAWYRNPITLSITSSQPVLDTAYEDVRDQRYYILDYTQENTMPQQGQLTCYTTGILLQAKYVPNKVYQADGINEVGTYTDLWLLDGKFYGEEVIGATKYDNATCYYRYYIRHSNNNNPGSMGVMEFGIVGKNINRIKVGGRRQIGTTNPDPDDTIEDDEYINTEIEVRQWCTRTYVP